jgi:GAF domain-containing protein
VTDFTIARIPSNEPLRLKAVHRTGLMDTDHSERFDLYTALMRQVSGFPVAYCGLIDETRQYFLSQNFPDCLNLPEVGRQGTLCQFALLAPTPLVVPDMRAHDLLARHPLVVGEPHFVSWAAFPLVTAEGYILGTLCAVDYVPRSLQDDQIDLMRRIAAELAYSIEVQVEHREEAARRMGRVLGELAEVAGLTTLQDAGRFLRLCEGAQGGADDLHALQASGLVEATGAGTATLSAEGRALQSRFGLTPTGFRAQRTVLKSDDLMTSLLDLVGA